MIHIPRWKLLLILTVCLVGVLYAIPSLLSRDASDALPRWLPTQQVPLGLDLQGGSHLLLEVDVQAVVKERLEGLADSLRSELRAGQVRFGELRQEGTSVVFGLREAADLDKARAAARKLAGSVAPSGGMFSTGGSDLDIATTPDGEIRVTVTETAIRELRDKAVAQSIEVINRRLNELGARELTVQQQGQDRILVQVPGLDDPEQVKRLLGQTAKLTFHLLDQNVTAVPGMRPPPGTQILMEYKDPKAPDGTPAQAYLVQRRIMVSGENLVDAQATFQEGRPVVSFRFDTTGARRFGEVTRNNVGRPFAIVLDNKVISAPVIREPILGGSGIISGGFTVQGASELALLLRAGALPAPLTVLEERTVGPDLGSDSIDSGKIASIIGYLLIAILMVVGYGLFGIVANIAMLLNLAFTLAIMAAIDATLTLPGIAGMVLGLAMAVDANVLIYERMREESRLGRSPFPAVDVAFQRAFVTIVDSNVTTLIAALLLYMFGAGPVRGFAVTLSIGIICSMFTSITVTRSIIVQWLRLTRPQALPI